MLDELLAQIGNEKDRQVQFLQLARFYILAVFLGDVLIYLEDRLLTHCSNKIAEYLKNEAY